jgi:hypothetical protein
MRKQTARIFINQAQLTLHLPYAVAGNAQPQTAAFNRPFTLMAPWKKARKSCFSASGIGSPVLMTSIRT